MTLLTRVLLVEDSPEFALLVAHVLRHSGGYEVVHVADLVEARDQIAQGRWEVLLTDIELPSGPCFDLLAYARSVHPGLLSVVMTSHHRTDYAVEALRQKADEFLLKPFEPATLLDMLKRLTDARPTKRAARRVLAIGAHPDDVELGCGATLRAHVLGGDAVHILTLCPGEAGGDVSMRMAESARAAELLGAGLTFGNLPDTRISEGADTIALIEECIGRVHPDVVYTHSQHDGHQDHRNVSRASVVAARRVSSLLCYQAPSATIDFRPTRFTDVSRTLADKQAAIAVFHSQAVQRAYMAPSMIEATARYWGRFAGYGLCEPFEAIRELSN